MSEEATTRLSAMRRHMGHSGGGMAPGREGVVPWESGMSAERGPCHTPRSAQLGGAEDERDGQELS